MRYPFHIWHLAGKVAHTGSHGTFHPEVISRLIPPAQAFSYAAQITPGEKVKQGKVGGITTFHNLLRKSPREKK